SALSPSPRINNTTTAARGPGCHGTAKPTPASINTTARFSPHQANGFPPFIGRLTGRLVQGVKGTAMPVPAADATTDAVQRNGVSVCAFEAAAAPSP
ncbi:unnamed protein product, partial [Tetraodon nigroviridis]